MAEIKSYVKPYRLYRYRSLEGEKFERELKAIEDSCIYCSPYLNLNDPMEGVFSSSEILRASEDYRRVVQAIRDEKSDIGICSFSEVHNHELMWAHYADQFKGICVAYHFPKLLKLLPKDVRFTRMFYSETVPMVRLSRRNPNYHAKMVLSYKTYKWLHEREWRMFARRGEAHYGNRNCVACVYLGSRMEPALLSQIKRRLREMRVKNEEMTIHKYSIRFGKEN